MIQLWGRLSAFNVQKVLWALYETGQPFEHIVVGGDAGGLNEPSFLLMNPNGRIPVLKDGDFVLWESHAIAQYLVDQYAPHLIHPDTRGRAEVRQWMDWSQTELQPPFMDLFWGSVRMPKEKQDANFNRRANQRTTQAMNILDAHLAHSSYLAGENFSLADIPAGTCLYRYFAMGEINRPDLPYLKRWYAHLCERPAYQKTVMLPFDDLIGKENF